MSVKRGAGVRVIGLDQLGQCRGEFHRHAHVAIYFEFAGHEGGRWIGVAGHDALECLWISAECDICLFIAGMDVCVVNHNTAFAFDLEFDCAADFNAVHFVREYFYSFVDHVAHYLALFWQMVADTLEFGPSPVTFIFVMVRYIVNLKHTVTALGCAVLLCGPVYGEQSPKVAELLNELRMAPVEQAQSVERNIQREWSKSGSAAMDLLLKRGRDAMAVGEYSVAIDHFTALTDHAPDFAEGFHARATAYYRADLYGPALDDLETALALNPDNFNAIFGLGVLFEELGDSRSAAELYRRVLALNPHHENAEKALEQLKSSGIGRTL